MRQKVLIIRFSALGDVAMTIPVIDAFAKQYPEIQVYVLSKREFSPIFTGIEENISFIGADFKSEHSGFKGLWLLFKQIQKINPDVVLDLHGVIRSYFIVSLFFLTGKRFAGIRKGRMEKMVLTRKRNKVLKPLLSVTERYRNVFKKAGFALNSDMFFNYKSEDDTTGHVSFFRTDKIKVGIAPFAKHHGKIYPALKMYKLLEMLVNAGKYEVILFGGGKEEILIMQEWVDKLPALNLIAGKYNLKDELKIMKNLDIMVSMDSANMHLASLMGTRVISVWGATHPYAGFSPWNQDESDFVQLDLDCRPCSVYGNKACFRKDYACLNGIEPEMIYKRIGEGQ